MNKKSIIKNTAASLAIPFGVFAIVMLLCITKGVVLFATAGNWTAFFRSVANVLLVTFALSINLNSGRFDFSLGSISLLSSVLSATICIQAGLSSGLMLILSLVIGGSLGALSGLLYIFIKLPPIIVSLGVTLFYEGLAFVVTDGYGVSFVTNRALTSFPGVRNYILLCAAAFVFVLFIFDHTKFGYDYKALLSGQKVAVNTGVNEKLNAVLCYMICGILMGAAGFISATNTGTIQMSLNFGSIVVMFSAFLPMFIGGFIGRFSSEKIGYVIGSVSMAFISLMYVRLDVSASTQQIITALLLVGFLIYLNNENKVIELVTLKNFRKKNAG